MRLDRTKKFNFLISDEQHHELWKKAQAEGRDVFDLLREFAGYDACLLDNDDLQWVMEQERLHHPDSGKPFDFEMIARWEQLMEDRGITSDERLDLVQKYIETGICDPKLLPQ